MLVFSCVNIETSGVSLIRDTVSYLAAKDQTTALHVVVHHVFKNWSVFCVVDQVEEDLLISGDVDSNVTFDEVKKTLMLKLEILGPVPFLSFLIIYSLEEKNVSRTSADKAGFFDQEHGSKINICDLFCLCLDCFISFSSFNLLDFDSIGLSLSIESINFLLSLVPETFVWEIKW